MFQNTIRSKLVAGSVHACMKVVRYMMASDCSHAPVAKGEVHPCGQVLKRLRVCSSASFFKIK